MREERDPSGRGSRTPFCRINGQEKRYLTQSAPKKRRFLHDQIIPRRAEHRAGGVAVLAHPKEPAFPFVREMVDLGLNGIEISHPGISENASKMAIRASLEYNLYC